MMGFLKLLGWRGIAGLAVALVLGAMLAAAKMDARHWKKQSGQFEQLYHAEQAAFAKTVADYRAAAAAARAADRAAAERVRAEQAAVNKEREDAFEKRIAAARARAGQLQHDAQAAAHPGGGGASPVPGVPAAAGGTDQAAGEGGLSRPDALTATEQAIQLDELIKWVRRQATIDPNADAPH